MYPFMLPMMFHYSDSESNSGNDEDDLISSNDELEQPFYEWDGERRAYKNDCGRTIIWTDGSCKNNHLGPYGGATSGVGIWIHGRKKWRKFNDVYPHTNNVSHLSKYPRDHRLF